MQTVLRCSNIPEAIRHYAIITVYLAIPIKNSERHGHCSNVPLKYLSAILVVRIPQEHKLATTLLLATGREQISVFQ